MKNSVQFIATLLSVLFLVGTLQANTNNLCEASSSSPGNNVFQFSVKHGGATGTNFFLAKSDQKISSSFTNVRKLKKISIKHHRRIEKIQVTLVDKKGKQEIKAAGGTGGRWSHIYLDNDEFIVRVSGRSGTLIDQLTIYTNKRRKFGPFGGNGGTPFIIDSPKNSRVVGFRGKSGNAINQIGLVYVSLEDSKPTTNNLPEIPVNRKYHIVSKVNNLNLDVKGGSKKSGTPIWMYKPNTSSAQHWTFESVGGGYYRIKSGISGLYLEVNGGSTKSGASIVQATKKRSPAQMWKAISAGGDYFYLQSRVSGLYLDVRGGGMSSKTPVWQHPLNKTNAQKWRLQKIKVAQKKKVVHVRDHRKKSKSKSKNKSNDVEIDMDRAGG